VSTWTGSGPSPHGVLNAAVQSAYSVTSLLEFGAHCPLAVKECAAALVATGDRANKCRGHWTDSDHRSQYGTQVVHATVSILR
jgi:hypothetical protein